jgi:hypothetical protein
MEGLVMRVDGTTPRDSIPPLRSTSLHKNVASAELRAGESTSSALAAQEARLSSSATVQAATRVVHDLHDTFQRGNRVSEPPPGYPGTGGPGAATPHVAGEEPQDESASLQYSAKIADLETTANARGLPLISERYADDPVYNGFLEGYSETGTPSVPAPSAARHDVLDTLG